MPDGSFENSFCFVVADRCSFDGAKGSQLFKVVEKIFINFSKFGIGFHDAVGKIEFNFFFYLLHPWK